MAQDAPLAGGASAVREERGDWILLCAAKNAVRACNLRQEQREASSNRFAVLVELIPKGNALDASIVVPLGVDLQVPPILQVDDGAPYEARYQSCIAQLGCALAASFDADGARRLAAGNTLRVTFTPMGQQAVTVSASLSGLTGALQRATELLSP